MKIPRGLLPVLAIAITMHSGCASWQDGMDGPRRQRVSEYVRDIGQSNLATLSSTRGATIEDELESVKQRRSPTPKSPPKEHLDLTVATLRAETLRNNLDLNVVLVDPELAQTIVSEEEAKFDATIFGGVEYKRENTPRLDGDLVEFTSDTDELDKKLVKQTQVEQTKEKLSFDVGVEVPLPTGGKVKLRNAFDEQNKLEPQRFEQYVSSLKFSYSQPLLRDAGVRANTASIRMARLNAQAVNAKTKLNAIRILAGAEKIYWQAYGAQKTLEIRLQQYNLAFDNLELVRKRASEGLSAKIEIVRAEVGVAQRLESLIIAETELRIKQRQLKRVLNMPDVELDSETTMNTLSAPQLLRFSFNRQDLAQSALDNRMEMLELELKLAADAIKIDLARNKALPLFVVDFEYGLLDRQGSMGSAWEGMWDFDNSQFTVGLRGEIPVTNNAREARLRQAMLSRVQRMATRELRELAIRQEVFDALDILDQNWQRILAARQNVVVSGVNYEAELKQFEEGLRTMREVLEVLSQLGDAQLREMRAIVAYQIAQVDLAFATGTLLGYAGMGFDPIPFAGQSGN
ncbi:MAG: hypothetical protein DHS20C16_09570 [Phycisphaerae bacterium]|nr:MAG: hypothetical protein DHS20C16_09570 [Phycisphaerae bacterium]